MQNYLLWQREEVLMSLIEKVITKMQGIIFITQCIVTTMTAIVSISMDPGGATVGE